MIVSLLSGVFALLKKPGVVVPALALSVINLALAWLAWEPLYGFLVDVLIFEEIPLTTQLAAMPYAFAQVYAVPLAWLVLLAAVSLYSQNFLMVFFARHLQEKEASVKAALGYALSRARAVLGLTVFLAALGISYAFASLLLMGLVLPLPFVGLLVVALWFLAGMVLLVRIVFLPVALAAGNATVRDALKASWAFTRKRVLSVFVLLLVLDLLVLLFNLLGDAVTSMMPFVELEIGLFMVFAAVGFSYSGLVLARYYLLGKG